MNATRKIIIETLNEIRADRGEPALEPQDSDTLTAEFGFDSLDLAVVVVRLEQRLGRDPFRDGRPLPATFGDWVTLYEQTEARA